MHVCVLSASLCISSLLPLQRVNSQADGDGGDDGNCGDDAVCVSGLGVVVTHRVEVLEEANGGRLRAVHRELEEGLHVQGGRKDRRTPEESRKWPRPMNTSCGDTSRIKAFVIDHMTVISTLIKISGTFVLLANLLYLALAL